MATLSFALRRQRAADHLAWARATPCTPLAICATKLVTAGTVWALAFPFMSDPRNASTSAEPTTTPSAIAAIEAALAAK
jgi:hypothetical protein